MSTAILDQFVDQLATAVADKLEKRQTADATKNKSPRPDNFMNKTETAKYVNVSTSTLNRWIKQRNFPSSKVGGKYVYKREDVDRWVAEHTK